MAKKKPQKQAAVVQASTTSQTEKNRQARIARHLKTHPTDLQAKEAAKHAGAPRKAPKIKGNFKKPLFKIRDASGKVTGYANYVTFYFAGKETLVNEKGQLVQNPEVKEVWNEYKSSLANAVQRKQRTPGKGKRKIS